MMTAIKADDSRSFPTTPQQHMYVSYGSFATIDSALGRGNMMRRNLAFRHRIRRLHTAMIGQFLLERRIHGVVGCSGCW